IAACYPTVATAQAAAIAQTSASGGCGGTVTKTASTSGTCSATVTVTATDSCGNSASVTYSTRIDNTAPALSANPANASYECYLSVPAAPTITANDNCDGPRTVSFNETQSNPGSSCSNTISRTWTASDTCGNVTNYTQVITVNDDQAPQIICNGAN